MAKKKVRSAEDIALELGQVRLDAAVLVEKNKTLSAAFKAALARENITEAGNYKLSTVSTLQVVDTALALKWAEGKNVLVIDIKAAREALRRDLTDSSKYGFAVVTSEKIVPKGGLTHSED